MEKIIEKKFYKFINAGILCQTIFKIQNYEGTIRLGHLGDIKMKNLRIISKNFQEAEIEFKTKNGIEWKVF